MLRKFFDHIGERFERDWPQILTSAGIHLILIFLLMLFVLNTGERPPRLQQIVDMQEEKEKDFLEDLAEDQVVLDKPLSIMNEAPGTVSETTELLKGDPSPTNEAAMAREINNQSRNRPLTSSLGKLTAGSIINGMKGSADVAPSGSGRGVLDVITREILRNLRKGPVLVAWIMDPTESMASTRELIADRFDGIYKELGMVGAIRGDSLLNAIISCGAETKFLTDKPTSDVPTIAKAIRSIKDDGQGTENFFDGVMKTATKYRRFQAGGNRIFMMIIVTDEAGDDLQNIDEATNMVKRNKALVYVLGPSASFAYPDMLVTATNASGETEQGYITRGPSTRRLEILKVPFNTTPYKDVWGPFGLSYISRESGAIYWILDDGRLSGPDYDTNALAEYKPFYGTTAEYEKEIGRNDYRKTLMDVCDAGNKLPHPTKLSHTFSASEAGKKVDELLREATPFLNFSRGAVARMEAADAKRGQEAGKTWKANFDLTMGRLLQSKVIVEEYVDALQKAKGPLQGGANAWRIEQSGTLDAGGGGSFASADGEAPAGGLATAPSNVLADRAKFYFQRVIDEHPGTPWALAAQSEMGQVFGFDAVAIAVPVHKPPVGAPGQNPNAGAQGPGGQGGAGGPPPKPPGPPRKL
jgi:hypothetical protein